MAAANTDQFTKAYQNFSTTIGAGGVASGSTTTIPLTSTTGLPTDTGIIMTINRIDGSGNVTNNSETVIGVVSGTNLTTCTRGIEGTAQAWGSGIVVEMLMTASHWNKAMAGILTEHNQDGTHSTIVSTSVTITPAAGVTPTTGGLMQYDSTTHTVKVGDGSATRTLVDADQAQTLTNKILPKIQGAASGAQFVQGVGEFSNGNSSTAITIDFSKGDRQSVTLTGNCTFTWSNPAQGQSVILRIVEDGTGGRTVTLPSGKWPSGVAGTFTTTASAINLLVIYYDGTNYLYQLASGFA